MLRGELEEHPRQADQIIEVAGCLEPRTGQLKNCRQHLLDRCFSVAAGHADHRNIETFSIGRSQITQRLQAVFDGYADNGIGDRVPLQPLFFCYDNGYAFSGNIGDEFVTVKALPAQRHEQLSCRNGAGIG